MATIDDLIKDLGNLKVDGDAAKNTISQLTNAFVHLASYGSEKLKGLTEATAEVVKKIQATGTVTKETQGVLAELVSDATKRLGDLTGSFGILSAAAGNTSTVFKSLMEGFSSGAGGANDQLAEMAVKTGVLMTVLTGMAKAPQGFADMRAEAMGAYESYGDLIKAIPGVGTALANVFEKGEYAKAFENNLAKMAAKSGSLSELWGAERLFGENFNVTVDKKMNDMVMLTLGAANTMGMTLQEGMKRNLEVLGALPDEIGKFYKINEADGVGAMQLLSTVATGTGQEFSKTIDFATKMYGSFLTTAKEAAEQFSLMSKVSNELQINFDKMESTVSAINNGFLMWGNSSKDTIGILREITTVLKEQGLGYEAGLEITQKLAGAIRDMGIEKKAFIAMGAGMEGTPLQAGLNVERMMQKGDYGEIANMLQETLGNIGGGGRVVNLEEAASSPGMEATFLAQRQALNMFGVSDTGTANRLMDVMSKIEVGKDVGKEGEEALKSAFNRGVDVQERQFNELKVISNKMDAAVNILGSIESYRLQRSVTGSEGAIGSDRASRMIDQQNMMGEKGGGSGIPLSEYAVNQVREVGSTISNFGTNLEAGGTKISEVLEKMGISISAVTGNIEANNKVLAQMGTEKSRAVEATGGTNQTPNMLPDASGGGTLTTGGNTFVIPPPPPLNTTEAAQKDVAAAAAAVSEQTGAGPGGIREYILNMNMDNSPIMKIMIDAITGVLNIQTTNTEGRSRS